MQPWCSRTSVSRALQRDREFVPYTRASSQTSGILQGVTASTLGQNLIWSLSSDCNLAKRHPDTQIGCRGVSGLNCALYFPLAQWSVPGNHDFLLQIAHTYISRLWLSSECSPSGGGGFQPLESVVKGLPRAPGTSHQWRPVQGKEAFWRATAALLDLKTLQL